MSRGMRRARQGAARLRRSFKILSIIVGTLFAVILIAIVGLAAYAQTDAFRTKMQVAASRGMGMQVSLDGPLRIGILPSPNVTLQQMRVQNRGVALGSVDQVYLRFRWLPLLRRDPEVEKVLVQGAHVLIRKGTDGTLDLVRSTPPVHKRAHGPIEIIATDSVIRYEDAKGGGWVQAEGCDAKVHQAYSEMPDGRRALERLSFSAADMQCKTVSAAKFTGMDLKLSATAPGKGIYDIQPITLQAFGAPATAHFHFETKGDDESYAASVSVPGVKIARILTDLGFHPIADGLVDLSGDMAYHGQSHRDLLETVTGSVAFHGNDITLQGYDLDKEMTRFERTQRFDVADFLGLFVLDGAGVLATKGYDYGQLISKRRGGVSHVHEAVAEVQISQGVVHAHDVAMSTDTHRLAAQGNLKLTTDDLDHVTLALVDAKGCPIAEEKLDGSIRKPGLAKGNILRTIAGPVRRLANKAEDIFTKSGCTPFYDGSVKPY
jgi:AsmA-like protein